MVSLKKISLDNFYSMHARVYLDGKHQKYAPFVDVENGYIIRVVMDSQGEIVQHSAGVILEKSLWRG